MARAMFLSLFIKFHKLAYLSKSQVIDIMDEPTAVRISQTGPNLQVRAVGPRNQRNLQIYPCKLSLIELLQIALEEFFLFGLRVDLARGNPRH